MPGPVNTPPVEGSGANTTFANSMFGFGRSILSYTTNMASAVVGYATGRTTTDTAHEQPPARAHEHHTPLFVSNFVRMVFSRMDKDGDGVITRADFETTMLRGLTLALRADHAGPGMRDAQAAAIGVLAHHLDPGDAGVDLTVFAEFMKNIIEVKLGTRCLVKPLVQTDSRNPNPNSKPNANPSTKPNTNPDANPTTDHVMDATATVLASRQTRGRRLGELTAVVKLLPIVCILEKALTQQKIKSVSRKKLQAYASVRI